jgi:hypothetical protein
MPDDADVATASSAAEFGAAPGAGLPAPLDDPLCALRRFLGWLMLAQIALVVGWLLYSFTVQRVPVEVGAWELGIQGIIIGLPFVVAFWKLLPTQVVNAYYLRSFRHDAATPAVRRSLSVALGREFRLSGIRDPRRRSIKVVRYLTVFIFALRYATSKYMNLEAEADWKQRLWRSLGDARCAIIDVSDLTSHVIQEIQMCFRCLGLKRMLFVCQATSLGDAGSSKAAIAQHLDLPSAESEVQVATWNASGAGRRAFEADVRRFADRLAAEPAGLRHDAFPLRGSPTSIDDAPGASDRWVWVELGLGLALAWGLSVMFKAWVRWTGPASTWVLLALVPLLGLVLCEFWEFLVYLKNCATLRERGLALLMLGSAWLWIGGVCFGTAVEQVQATIHRLVSASNLTTIALAMRNFEENTNEPVLADGVLKWKPPANANSPLLSREERIRAKTPPPSKPPISWRVAILPYIGEPDLFREYNTDEPWDSPNNIQLVERMPKIYAMPGAEKETRIAVAVFRFLARKLQAMPEAEPGAEKKTLPGHTYYRVFVSGPASRAQAAFTRGKARFFRWISDQDHTILVAEAADAVPWTKPDELEYDPTGPLPKLGGHFPGVFQAALVTGEVRAFHSDMPEAELRDWITGSSGNQMVAADEVGHGRPATSQSGTRSLTPRTPREWMDSLQVHPALNGTARTTVTPIAATGLAVHTPITIGAHTPFSVTAKALDRDGNEDHSYVGSVHFSSTDGRATLPANYTFTVGDDGEHTFSATLGTLGSQAIIITDTATGSITGQASVMVTPGSATHFTLTGPTKATEEEFFKFVVTAFDPYGNVASGYRGTVRITSSNKSASLPDNYTYRDSDAGSHTFAIKPSRISESFSGSKRAPAKKRTLTATDISTTSITGDMIVSVVEGGPPHFIVKAEPATADKEFLLSVEVKDPDGDVAIDYQGTVGFTSSDRKAILPAPYTFTEADRGMHVFSVTLTKAGRQTVAVKEFSVFGVTGGPGRGGPGRGGPGMGGIGGMGAPDRFGPPSSPGGIGMGGRRAKAQTRTKSITGMATVMVSPDRPGFRYQLGTSHAMRAMSRVNAGQIEEGIDEIAELAKSSDWNLENWYNFACVYALAAGKSPQKKQEYGDRAMELLNKAVQAGLQDVALLTRDEDLSALRNRDDFKKLIAELTNGKQAAKKP